MNHKCIHSWVFTIVITTVATCLTIVAMTVRLLVIPSFTGCTCSAPTASAYCHCKACIS